MIQLAWRVVRFTRIPVVEVFAAVEKSLRHEGI
jgi:hypothetical protein